MLRQVETQVRLVRPAGSVEVSDGDLRGKLGDLALSLLRALPTRSLLHELRITQVVPTPDYGDSESTKKIAKDAMSMRKSSYLLRKAKVIQQTHKDDTFANEHIPGVDNIITDALSRKHAPGYVFTMPTCLESAHELVLPVRGKDYYRTLANRTPAVAKKKRRQCG